MVISCHVCKRKTDSVRGIQLENNRKPGDHYVFPLSEIDWSRTKDNVFLVRSDNWLKDIDLSLSEHGIHSYRKDAIVLIDVVYSASKEFFETSNYDTVLNYFSDCLHFHGAEYGTPLNAVIHFDESTPHLHIVSVPIVERDKGFALSAKEIVGNRFALIGFHDRLYTEVGVHYDLERGTRSDGISKKRHLETYQFKLKCLLEQIDIASNDLEKLEKDIERTGNIKDISAWANSIASKLSNIIPAMAGNSVSDIQYGIENRNILLEKQVAEAGCHISSIGDGKYCCVSDKLNHTLSWDSKVPLYIQDGARFIPSSWILDKGEIVPWIDKDIRESSRDLAESSPVESLYEVVDDLDQLIDTIDNDRDDLDLNNTNMEVPEYDD